jgi:1-acyl-sn-glycerol-3-phosphate acyltransferase
VSLRAWLNRPGPLGRVWRYGYEGGYNFLRAVVHLVFRCVFRIRQVGGSPRIPPGGVLFCANHCSYLDPAFVQLVVRRRITFVMTNDFYERPWGRWFFRLVGAVPVARGRMARRGMQRAVALLRRGHAVGLFPEGRLSRDGTLSAPQRGVALIARLGRASVVPMGIAGNFRAWPHGTRVPRRSNVRVAFGRPLPAPVRGRMQTREDEQAFAAEIMRRIALARAYAERHGVPPDEGGTGARAAPAFGADDPPAP